MAGVLRKMKVGLEDPVNYYLSMGNSSVYINKFLDKPLCIQFTGKIFCIQCGRNIKKSFQNGYCFPCYKELLSCGLCIIHPERCRVGEKICDPCRWAHVHCHERHVLYFANTDSLKVGITTEKNMPSRWIDQGASAAMPVFFLENRDLSTFIVKAPLF